MKNHRLLTLTLIAITALGVFVIPAVAQSPSDLNVLARYFPAETPVLISLRTDGAFIDTLNDVIGRVQTAIPDAGDESLDDALNELTEEIFPGGTFEEDLRPLLGDTATIGITSTQGLMGRGDDFDGDEAPAIVAVSIQNRAAVVEAITNAAEDNVTASEEDGYTLFTATDPDEDDAAVIVRDDVMLIYANMDTTDVLAAGGVVDGSLGDSADFTSALALLPEPTYNITVYIDLLPLIEASSANDPEAAEALSAMSGMLNALGKQVWGFTILGGDSLAMDIASQITDLSVFEDMGLSMGSTPLDLSFASHIPAGVPLAVIGTDLKTSLSSSASSLNFALQSNPAAGSDFNPKDVEAAIKQIDQAFTQYTGLNFEQDVLSWMTGEYAFFLGLNPQFDTTSQFGLFQAFPVDFGFVIEAGDSAQAQATVAGLSQALDTLIAEMGDNSDVETEAEITTEEIGGADVTIVTITAENMPWPLELLMGANDEVFALGTRSAVRAILAPDGGLPSNTEFTRTSPYILPNAVSVGWLNTSGLLPLADLITAFENNNDEAEEDADEARAAINLFSSGTLSASFDAESGVSLARFVLTFSAE